MVSINHPVAQRKILPVVYVALGATMISFSAVFVKLAHVGPTTAGFYRVLFGGLLLTVVVLMKGEMFLNSRHHALLVLASAALFSLDLTFWHRSINYVGPGLATLLANFQVFFLALFGALVLKEKLTWNRIISIPMAMAGLYLIVGIHWSALRAQYKWGVVLGIITAICYASYILTLRKSQAGSSKPSSLSTVASISLVTALIMGIEVWIQKEGFLIPDLQSWGALVGYGLVGQVLGWVLISTGLPKMEASRAGLTLLLQPTLAFVWDILFFARPTTVIDLLGAFITLIAIYIGTVK